MHELTRLLKSSRISRPLIRNRMGIVNRVLEEMLRHYVSLTQDDWDEHLAAAENNAKHESTQASPF